MRKSIGMNVAVLVIAMVLTSGTAFAGNGIPISGPHWNINFIGRPNDKGIGEGGDSSGHSIMIPLRNVSGEQFLRCDLDGVNFEDDIPLKNWTQTTISGTKIYFVGGDHFEIIDRDAMDGSGTIMVPIVDTSAGTTGEFKFQVYMRVLGKPNKVDGTVACMNINAYAEDQGDLTTWYKAGTVTVKRAKGKSTFVRVTDLFTVWFCTEWNGDHTECLDSVNLSVFNDIFDAYFWQILNDGTRLVQVRIYPTDTVYIPPTQ